MKDLWNGLFLVGKSLSPVTFSRTFILVSNNSAVETTAGFPSSTNLRMVRQMGKSSSCSGPLQSIFGCNWSLFLRSIPWTTWRQTNVWLMSRNCPYHCHCPCPFQRRGCDNSRNLTEFKHNTWELVVNGTCLFRVFVVSKTPQNATWSFRQIPSHKLSFWEIFIIGVQLLFVKKNGLCIDLTGWPLVDNWGKFHPYHIHVLPSPSSFSTKGHPDN